MAKIFSSNHDDQNLRLMAAAATVLAEAQAPAVAVEALMATVMAAKAAGATFPVRIGDEAELLETAVACHRQLPRA